MYLLAGCCFLPFVLSQGAALLMVICTLLALASFAVPSMPLLSVLFPPCAVITLRDKRKKTLCCFSQALALGLVCLEALGRRWDDGGDQE